jgi:alcohol dehydrogenase
VKPFYYHAPRELQFGEGVSEKLGMVCRNLSASRAIIVTSSGMPKRNFFNRLCDSLKRESVAFSVFDKVSPEPPVGDLQNCVKFAGAYRPDIVIGVGGGSALDVAKTGAILLKTGGTVHDYFGMHNIPCNGLPTVMLPTTAGSGSEVTPNSVFVVEEENIKRGIEDPHQIPSCALIDPVLSMSMPPQLTAATGMDALTHAIESYVSKRSSPLSETFSLQAISLISRYLKRAWKDGSDMEARSGMALAATVAGLAFGNAGTGGVHACAYPLSSRFKIPHGKANALMLPYVVAFNMEETPKYDTIRRYFGEKLPEKLHELLIDLKLPARLSEVGIAESDIIPMAEQVIKIERHWSINPRRPTKEDIIAIYRKAL